MMKENKVEHLKTALIEIKLSPLAFMADIPEVTEPEIAPTSGDELTDELLFYSSPGRPS